MSSIMVREINDRKITRLCHFTRSNKAVHILSSESGLVAVDFLDKDIYDANDESRMDGRTDCINCSIQYPNYWYYRRVKDKVPLFTEWVVLFINPELLLHESTEFCFTNAAYGRGAFIKKGNEAFEKLFDYKVTGKRTFFRTDNMLSCCPTDDQAEVLVYRNISRKDIIGVAVPTEEQAIHERIRWYNNLKTVPDIDIIIAPDLFNGAWSDKVREGIVPLEYKFDGGE